MWNIYVDTLNKVNINQIAIYRCMFLIDFHPVDSTESINSNLTKRLS